MTLLPPSSHPPTISPPAFPFSALVGQPRLQQALLLAAVDPGIGGVLISGPRGTAKSTAARALAALLPGAPFITLPLAASLEQLVGTLDVEDALRDGRLRLRPGLLARAHGGVLYVDEVNLLPDALIDALLDAAAGGVHTVERDGISQQHASRFVLVGTMNPEEGELRPQLLDRFGLAVTLTNPADPAARMAILRARLAYEADPSEAAQRHAAEEQRLAAAVAAARAKLPGLGWCDAVVERAARQAHAAAVDGLRADLVMLRAARALAALEQHDAVRAEDVDAVADLALAHRRDTAAPPTSHPAPPPGPAAARPAAWPPAGPCSSPDAAAGQDAAARPEATTGPAAARSHPPLPAAEGHWGALPPQPTGLTRLAALEAWPPKA